MHQTDQDSTRLPQDAGGGADPARIRHLVVIGHPAADSFTHAAAAAYCAAVRACGQAVTVRDLYATGFDPLLKANERPGAADFRLSDDVIAELAHVEAASAIVLFYPIWFGMPPAIIAGYVERVLGAGFSARQVHAGERHDLLSGKPFILVTTSASTLPWLAEHGQWQGLREAFDFYLESIFGFASCDHEHFDAIVTPLLPSYAADCIERTRLRARLTCSSLLSAAHHRQKQAKLARTREPVG